VRARPHGRRARARRAPAIEAIAILDAAKRVEASSGGDVNVIWLLVLILAVLAIGGGVALSKFLFLLLIAALAVALFGFIGGRSTA
jgi:hypothetical protein